MLAKKAVIARLRGDEKLAEDWASNCLDVIAKAEERSADTDAIEVR